MTRKTPAVHAKACNQADALEERAESASVVIYLAVPFLMMFSLMIPFAV